MTAFKRITSRQNPVVARFRAAARGRRRRAAPARRRRIWSPTRSRPASACGSPSRAPTPIERDEVAPPRRAPRPRGRRGRHRLAVGAWTRSARSGRRAASSRSRTGRRTAATRLYADAARLVRDRRRRAGSRQPRRDRARRRGRGRRRRRGRRRLGGPLRLEGAARLDGQRPAPAARRARRRRRGRRRRAAPRLPHRRGRAARRPAAVRVDLRGPVAILIGGEGPGLRPALVAARRRARDDPDGRRRSNR